MSEMIEQTVGERIVDLFQAEGVKAIFSVPDPGYLEIHHHAVKKGIRIVSPRHEAAGGFMADSLSRMTGRMGVVMAGEGPGVANMLPAAVCASKENVPVLFLAAQRGRVFDSSVRRSKFQYTPQPRFFEPAMKYVGVVEFAAQVDEVFHEAFRQAMTGKPGPVFVELPEDHQFEKLRFDPIEPPERYRMTSQQADPSAVDRAAELLAGAELPILIAGTGVHTARGQDLLERLAGQLQCPVIPTWGGRGVLPETHPQVLFYSTEPANAAIAQADVVLAVGTSIGETLHYGTARHFAQGGSDRRWIYVERDAGAVGVNRPIDVPLIGDLRDVLPQLTRALEPHGPFRAPRQLAEWRSQLVEFRQKLIEAAPDRQPIHPGRLMTEARKAIPDDAVIVRDGGCTALFELAYHEQRSRDYIWTSKFGHLGTGLPYAIGAQIAVAEARRVCLITGDSALMFHLMELETAARHSLPIVIVVNYDHSWGMELSAYVDTYGEDGGVEIEHSRVRLDLVAQGLGAHGEYVEHTSDIGPAIERAFASGKPALVQVVTDPKINGLEAPNWEEFITWYGVDGAYKALGTDYTAE